MLLICPFSFVSLYAIDTRSPLLGIGLMLLTVFLPVTVRWPEQVEECSGTVMSHLTIELKSLWYRPGNVLFLVFNRSYCTVTPPPPRELEDDSNLLGDKAHRASKVIQFKFHVIVHALVF